jgi:hypothetical protein
LNIDYINEYVKAKFVLQDVRTWGNQAQLVGNEEKAISVHEAWAEIILSKQFALKLGRQELVYDNHRVFGNVGWAQQGRAHDIALLKYKTSFDLHFGLAHNENTNRTNDFYETASYKDMQFVWINKKIETTSLSFLFLNNGVPQTTLVGDNITEQKTKYSQTIGSYIKHVKDDFTIDLSLYFQTGKDVSDKDISAYNIGFNLGYKFSENLSATIGVEILSGTAYNETDKNKSFNPFYGTNHKFNGFMDYFYVGNHINSVGLVDNYLKIKYKHKKFSTQLHTHYFLSQADINSTADKDLGIELDFTASYKLNKSVNLSAGYSQIFGSENLQILKSGNKSESSNWAWLMVGGKI